MDSSEQVAKLAYRSEVGQKIEKLRTVAKSQYQGNSDSETRIKSQFHNSNALMQTPSPKIYSPRRGATLTPGAFKKRYSEQLSTDLVKMKRIQSMVAERHAKDKPSTDKEPSLIRLKRVDTVKENDIDSLDSENSESVKSDPFGKLDVSDGAGQENKPTRQLAVAKFGPEQDESGDAKGKHRDLVL
jgi:hypothetical protein